MLKQSFVKPIFQLRFFLAGASLALAAACASQTVRDHDSDSSASTPEPEPEPGPGGGPPGPGPAPGPGSGADAGAPPGETCAHEGPPKFDPSDLPECDLCAGARCLPASLVPDGQADRLADCADGTKCVPDEYIETGGKFILDTCASVGGAEGRCASLCLPEVAAKADQLPQSSCAPSERCAPCFDPFDGSPTGVCSISCDPGPTETPTTFDKCCGGIGSCIAQGDVPPDFASRLGQDACSGGFLCAPDELSSSSAVPTTCRSTADAEGRCMPLCLPEVAKQADRLPQDVCPPSHACSPCFDPTSGEETGVCGLGADPGPAEPPVVFPKCCDLKSGATRGTCVPTELVPASRKDSLQRDSCPKDDNSLCVPDVFLDNPDHKFAPCLTAGLAGSGAPGACVPDCVIGIEKLFLGKSTCADGEKCAPCVNPLDGEVTGACG